MNAFKVPAVTERVVAHFGNAVRKGDFFQGTATLKCVIADRLHVAFESYGFEVGTTREGISADCPDVGTDCDTCQRTLCVKCSVGNGRYGFAPVLVADYNVAARRADTCNDVFGVGIGQRVHKSAGRRHCVSKFVRPIRSKVSTSGIKRLDLKYVIAAVEIKQ